jgi:hypothetical protein
MCQKGEQRRQILSSSAMHFQLIGLTLDLSFRYIYSLCLKIVLFKGARNNSLIWSEKTGSHSVKNFYLQIIQFPNVSEHPKSFESTWTSDSSFITSYQIIVNT